MSGVLTFALVTLVLAALLSAVSVPLLRRNPRGSISFGLAFLFGRIYVRLIHRLRFEGLEHLSELDTSRGLITAARFRDPRTSPRELTERSASAPPLRPAGSIRNRRAGLPWQVNVRE